MNRRAACLLAVVVLVSSACGTSSPPASATPGGGEVAIAQVARLATTSGDASAAAAAVNAFGLDLYRVAAKGAGNAVVSPASVALALAMARAGARGETASQMDAVLRRFGADDVAAWPAALDLDLAARNGTFKDASGQDLAVVLRIANAPFAQRGMPIEQAYLDALSARFAAGLRLVDYAADSESARRTINTWVDDRTEHRIPELLVPGVIASDTRLTLVNAIYLKAAWQTAFSDSETKPAPFTRADGSTVDVPTMHLSESFRYAAGDGWVAVELPYVGGQLAMTVILPDDLATFEAALDPSTLVAVIGALQDRQIDLSLPRFGIETKTRLADALAGLGMPAAFDDARADFSGITTAERLVIGDVIHQANIDVDEKGTTAAAATAVVMRATGIAAEPLTVRVDRPFLFALRDVPTGAVLFLGRVADPSLAR